MNFVMLLGLLFKLNIFYANTRESISNILLNNHLQLKCIKDADSNQNPYESLGVPIEVFNVVNVQNKNKEDEMYRRKGYDNRPHITTKEYDIQIIKKYIKMQKILERLNKQLDENKTNELANNHSVFDKIPQLDSKHDIKKINLKRGGLMKNYEGYIFTDW